MPKKIHELKRMLKKAGFFSRPGKGSHSHWWHTRRPKAFTLSGQDGADAKLYQVREVEDAIRDVEEGQ